MQNNMLIHDDIKFKINKFEERYKNLFKVPYIDNALFFKISDYISNNTKDLKVQGSAHLFDKYPKLKKLSIITKNNYINYIYTDIGFYSKWRDVFENADIDYILIIY